MDKVFVFIDEFGNTSLDIAKPGTFSHFVYSAIVIKESDVVNARLILSELSKRYNQNSPFKSSKSFGGEKGLHKRLQVLSDLKRLNFVILSSSHF